MILPLVDELTQWLEDSFRLNEKHDYVKGLSFSGQDITNAFKSDRVLINAQTLDNL